MKTLNPWDEVEVKDGELQGVLTDKLLRNVMVQQEPIRLGRSNITETRTRMLNRDRRKKPIKL